jgi:hypothetical protein
MRNAPSDQMFPRKLGLLLTSKLHKRPEEIAIKACVSVDEERTSSSGDCALSSRFLEVLFQGRKRG